MKKEIKAFLVFCDGCGIRLESDNFSYVFFKDKDMDTVKEQIENALDEEYWTKKGNKCYCNDCDEVLSQSSKEEVRNSIRIPEDLPSGGKEDDCIGREWKPSDDEP